MTNPDGTSDGTPEDIGKLIEDLFAQLDVDTSALEMEEAWKAVGVMFKGLESGGIDPYYVSIMVGTYLFQMFKDGLGTKTEED